MAPLYEVADVVMVDSATKYDFRWAVADYLRTRSAASEGKLRNLLKLWANNDALLQPYFAQSKESQGVSEHSRNLSNLANAALQFLNVLSKGQSPEASQKAVFEAALKVAKSTQSETEIAVVPEIEGLFLGKLEPEPKTYPLV